MSCNHILQNHEKCTGCGNCFNSCPRAAIKMQPNFEGFLYPVVDEDLCINCGICKKVCLIENDVRRCDERQDSYIAITKDKKLYKSSASGGVFSTMAKFFLDEFSPSVAVGAAFAEKIVQHLIIDKADDLFKIQNSKYVQSSLSTIFPKIKQLLVAGNFVLFSGTPCQVGALKLFLEKDYDNLYTIDIICHGVPSPELLKKDVELYTDLDAVQNISFRKKNYFFKKKSGFFLSIDHNGKKIVVPSSRDVYFNLFLKGYTFRKSCYKCDFSNLSRVSDITIGDCDSAGKYVGFHSKEATSTVIVNTEKGRELWKCLSDLFDSKSLDIIEEAKVNHQLAYPAEFPEIRNTVYVDLMNADLKSLRNKYAKERDFKEFLIKFKFLYLP